MTEAQLKTRVMAEARARLHHYMCERHEDHYRHGWPDISIIGHQRTSYWEVKYGSPYFKTTGIQELTCIKLASISFCCRYLIFEERQLKKHTKIVHPLDIHNGKTEQMWEGFDVVRFIDYVKWIHER